MKFLASLSRIALWSDSAGGRALTEATLATAYNEHEMHLVFSRRERLGNG